VRKHDGTAMTSRVCGGWHMPTSQRIRSAGRTSHRALIIFAFPAPPVPNRHCLPEPMPPLLLVGMAVLAVQGTMRV